MSLLYLVRHGQASFYGDDYDQLSELGVEQAHRLGVHWAELNLSFDHVYVGPRRRHRQTLDTIAAVYRGRGLRWPESRSLPELDEHSGPEVLTRALPELLQRDPVIRELKKKFRRDSDTAQRDYLRVFQKVTRMWVRRELSLPELEAWHEFRSRVQTGLTRMTDVTGSKMKIVAITSGGPVAVATGFALALAEEKTLELSWVIRNAAYSEFLFSRGRFSLLSFNAVPHLTDPHLQTFL